MQLNFTDIIQNASFSQQPNSTTSIWSFITTAMCGPKPDDGKSIQRLVTTKFCNSKVAQIQTLVTLAPLETCNNDAHCDVTPTTPATRKRHAPPLERVRDKLQQMENCSSLRILATDCSNHRRLHHWIWCRANSNNFELRPYIQEHPQWMRRKQPMKFPMKGDLGHQPLVIIVAVG